MVKSLMMSAKMATPGLLKIKLFCNKFRKILRKHLRQGLFFNKAAQTGVLQLYSEETPSRVF